MKKRLAVSEIITVITIIVFLSIVSAVIYNVSIFTHAQYKLTIQSPNGSGSTNPATGSYNHNQDTYAKITATSSSGWQFDHWVLDGSIASALNPITVTMGSSHIIKAVFVQSSTQIVYHCAFVSTTDTWDDHLTSNVRTYINNYVALTGKPLYMYWSWGNQWKGSPEGGDLAWILAYGADGKHSLLPIIQEGLVKAISLSWNPYKTTNDQQTLKNIATGLDDDYIKTIAGECKSFGYPIYMRWGGEMNICQGQDGMSGWATNATDYVNAWRRIVDIFRNQGVTNVLWVWNPNCVDIGPNHWTDYYPGDNYVDWVGIDIYQYNDNVDPAYLMSGIYDDYAGRKPIGIFEWGVNSHDWTGQNTSDLMMAAWMDKFFNAVEARPGIKLILYFYYNTFRFETSNQPLTTSTYKTRIANSLYIH